MIRGGRQEAPDISGIREDHVERYRHAGFQLRKDDSIQWIMDVGCGVGYGSYILAQEFGFHVIGIDVSEEAIEYGRVHYSHPKITRLALDLKYIEAPKEIHAVVAFEIIEHIEEDKELLTKLRTFSNRLIGSVPNEAVIPHALANNKDHFRHYTREQLVELLASSGWALTGLFSQTGKRGPSAKIMPGGHGRHLIFTAG